MHVGDMLHTKSINFIILTDLGPALIDLKYKCHGGSHDNNQCNNPSMNNDLMVPIHIFNSLFKL
jgi:hypothetical protein